MGDRSWWRFWSRKTSAFDLGPEYAAWMRQQARRPLEDFGLVAPPTHASDHVLIYGRPVNWSRLDGLDEITEHCAFQVRVGEWWHTIICPKGMVTDFSSYRWTTPLVPKRKTKYAGLAHDSAFQSGVVDRKTADAIWRIIARAGKQSVGPVGGWTMWAALRVASWNAWRKWRAYDGVA